MLNVIRRIYKSFAFINFGISCLALIFNLSYPRTTILQAENRFQVVRYNKSYTDFFERSIQIYGSVVKVSGSKSSDLGSIPAGCSNSLPPLGHFWWH